GNGGGTIFTSFRQVCTFSGWRTDPVGGWLQSWADESTVYFHRRAEDGWWSIYRLNLDQAVPPEQITPPSVEAFTPCASATGNWIAVATRRPESKFKHIEIFDLQSRSFIPVTASINPQIHHYNPFVSPDSLRVGFHRFRGEDGKQLVFRSERSGHKKLYIMDAEEGEEGWIGTLTEGPRIDMMPC
ncbi:hypothetical protein KI387_039500, partial [Taxus chinensis]